MLVILRIAAAIQNRSQLKGWGWIVASGLITIVFAGIVVSQLPTATLVLLGVLTGINFFMSGCIQIVYGMAARRLSTEA